MLGEYLRLIDCGHFVRVPGLHEEHSHPMDHLLIWVLGGQGWVSADGLETAARPGQVFLCVPGAARAYRADTTRPWEILWARFGGRLAPRFAREIRAFGVPAADLGLDAEVRDRWIELVIAHKAQGPAVALRTNTGLYALLGLIAWRLQRHTLQPETEGPLDVPAIQAFVHAHYREPLTLAQLAREAGFSPSHFSRLFKHQFGTSPVAYVIQKRMGLACEMLVDTSMRLKQISRSVGYDDPYYFSRLFKKVMGISPIHYRRSRRQAQAAASA